jgi:hypothetical protein
MSNLFSVKTQLTGEEGPKVLASGLSHGQACRKAKAEFDHAIELFRGPFNVTIGSGSFEAQSRTGVEWGFSYYVEAEETAVSELELTRAFDILGKVIEAEGGDPGQDRFTLGSIELDLRNILRGKLAFEADRVVYN